MIVSHRAENKQQKKAAKGNMPGAIALLRLVIVIAVLIITRTLHIGKTLSVILMILALVIGGADIALNAFDAVKKKSYFDSSCLVTVSALAVFAVGCRTEAVVFIIVYQLMCALLGFAASHTRSSAYGFIPGENKELYANMRSMLNKQTSYADERIEKVRRITDIVVKAACGVAVLYAVLLPLISDMTVLTSVRRAAMLLIAVVPTAMFEYLPLCAVCGVSLSSAYGTYVENSGVFPEIASVTTVVFDKAEVITGGVPKISAVVSPIIDKNSFLMAAAYTACKSSQKLAAQIVAAYNGDISREHISDFEDINGIGMSATVKGRNMLLGTRELFELRGIELDEKYIRSGYVLYLAIQGRYAGCIIFSENTNPYAQKAVDDLDRMGVQSVLISNDSESITGKTAGSIGIKVFHAACDTVKKLALLRDIRLHSDRDEHIMYVSAEPLEYHTEADVDVRVGASTDTEDVTMSNIGIFGLPLLIDTARYANEIVTKSMIALVTAKLLLIILSLFGLLTLWFVALLDISMGILAILNVTSIITVDIN